MLLTGCGREKIEAVNLANEATMLKKQGAYDAAIDKYEAATQLDPTNHEIIYMLATTYKKKEEWVEGRVDLDPRHPGGAAVRQLLV